MFEALDRARFSRCNALTLKFSGGLNEAIAMLSDKLPKAVNLSIIQTPKPWATSLAAIK